MKDNYLIRQGDCMELMKKIPDKSIDLIVTDPPYEIVTSGGGLYTHKDKQYVKELNFIKNGYNEEILDEMIRILKKSKYIYFLQSKANT